MILTLRKNKFKGAAPNIMCILSPFSFMGLLNKIIASKTLEVFFFFIEKTSEVIAVLNFSVFNECFRVERKNMV